MENKIKTKGKRCAKCESKFVYIRIKDNELVCRSCGHISKLKKDKDDEKKGE